MGVPDLGPRMCEAYLRYLDTLRDVVEHGGVAADVCPLSGFRPYSTSVRRELCAPDAVGETSGLSGVSQGDAAVAAGDRSGGGGEFSGDGGVDGAAVDGDVFDSVCHGGAACGDGVDCSSGAKGGSGECDGSERRELCGEAASLLNGEVRGKHWRTNKMKRERRKQKRAECYSATTWRRGATGTSTASVVTVDSRTAEEIEAARTLAVRRAAENKVAAALAEHRLRSLQDEDKTVAVRRLEAARLEQRINDAKAKSQASYKKCDNSLKSLGSTGSAGEFALKQVVTKSEILKDEVENLRRQVEVALAAGGPAAYAAVAKLPEPKKYGIRDVMNPPDASWSREETDAYYAIVDEEDNGNYDSNWADFFPSGRLTEEEMEAEAAMYMHG